MLVANIIGGITDALKKTKDWLLGLPTSTKHWTIGAIVLWGLSTLVGGRIAEAAFIAFFYCLAVWTLLCEVPWVAERILDVGLIADVIVTIGASMFMPGSVSIGYAMLFFGIYFTCFRKAVGGIFPRIKASVAARKAARKEKAEEEAEKGESKPGVLDTIRDAVTEITTPKPAGEPA